jgi:hypothetical protein
MNRGIAPPKINNTDVLVQHYLDQGLTVTEAAKKTGISRVQASNIKSKLNKYKVTAPDLLKKTKTAVHKIVDDFNNGTLQADGKTPAVRPSDMLRIVEMQQDRIDPVIKSAPESGSSISFTQVNINNAYLGASPDAEHIQDSVSA